MSTVCWNGIWVRERTLVYMHVTVVYENTVRYCLPIKSFCTRQHSLEDDTSAKIQRLPSHNQAQSSFKTLERSSVGDEGKRDDDFDFDIEA